MVNYASGVERISSRAFFHGQLVAMYSGREVPWKNSVSAPTTHCCRKTTLEKKNWLMLRRLLWLTPTYFLLLQSFVRPQGTVDDYRRAQEIRSSFPKAFRKSTFKYHWSETGIIFEDTSHGEPQYRVIHFNSSDLSSDTPQKIFTSHHDYSKLEPRKLWSKSSGNRTPVTITFKNTFNRSVRIFWVTFDGKLKPYGDVPAGESRAISTYDGHQWVLDFSTNKLAGIFSTYEWDCTATLNPKSQQCAMEGFRGVVAQANKHKTQSVAKLVIRNHNVWLRSENQKDQLTTDGNEADVFLNNFHYSPNKKYAVGFQETQIKERQIPLLTSTPDDQVQPTMRWIDYAKPGDSVPQRRPRLFHLGKKQAVPCDDHAFLDSWSVRFLRWSPDSSRAYVLFNKRGHQQLTLRSIDPETGHLQDIVHETSKTFIDYSQKTMIRWIDSANEVMWASERDGWNHLYRYDALTGQQMCQITQGEWVVRSIEHVDERRGVIWFAAMGIHPDQDPYHVHLARVNFDGTELRILTDGNGTHRWEFNADRSLFIDRWSRVDLPEVVQLRESEKGSVVAELFSQDISVLRQQKFIPPIRFASPGRDGKTMIYGTLILPSNFDPEKSYPLVEHIYAGPQDFHVPKQFGIQVSDRRLAELGFIIARIDGMGTNWRSKKFHDVCWKNLSDAGLPDRIAWLKAAAERYSWIDLSRIGIYGGSAGGQNALAAVLHHGQFYKAAASDCGCHDNRMDKIWWNEAWMGKLGPHYKQNSNVTHASKLQGDLLLTVGEVDTNVDPASTLQVVDALIQAKKDFVFMLVPNGEHGVGESDYLFRRRQDFFVRSLLGVEPRR